MYVWEEPSLAWVVRESHGVRKSVTKRRAARFCCVALPCVLRQVCTDMLQMNVSLTGDVVHHVLYALLLAAANEVLLGRSVLPITEDNKKKKCFMCKTFFCAVKRFLSRYFDFLITGGSIRTPILTRVFLDLGICTST